MKIKRFMAKKWVKVILVTVLVNMLFITQGFPLSTQDNIPLDQDEWNGDGHSRDLNIECFSAYLDNGVIYILNTAPFYDLDISIIDSSTGDEVYYNHILKEESGYVPLSLLYLPNGNYCLRIYNPVAGYVNGCFSL